MNERLWVLILQLSGAFLLAAGQGDDAESWKPLFNSRDLTGWDKYLGPPRGSSAPLGLNHDPAGVFSVVDVEGERVTEAMESLIPYKKEDPGERLIVYKKRGKRITSTPEQAITPNIDYEKYDGAWNSVEVIFWGRTGIHLLNGRVNLVITN